MTGSFQALASTNLTMLAIRKELPLQDSLVGTEDQDYVDYVQLWKASGFLYGCMLTEG